MIKTIILIICSIFLVSCHSDKVEVSDISPIEVTEDNTMVENVNDGIIRLTNGTNQSALPQVGNEEGYYYYYADGSGVNIIYTDYQTQKEYYLCSNVACTHENESCSSYMETSGFLFLGSNKLYFLQDSTIFEEDSFNQKIYEMNLNGDNKNLIYEFKGYETYFGGHIFGSKEKIYVPVADDVKESNVIIEIDLHTKESRTVCDIGVRDYVVGSSEQTLYILKGKPYDAEVYFGPTQLYIEAFDMISGEFETVYNFQEMNVEDIQIGEDIYKSPIRSNGYKIYENKLYIIDTNIGELQIFDLKNGELINEINLNSVTFNEEQIIIEFINDEILIINSSISLDRYIVDLIDNTVIKSELKTAETHGYDGERVLAPVQVTDKYVLFYNGAEPTIIKEVMPDGTIVDVNTILPILNIIEIDDYKNNIENYERISLFNE